ncbi:MAG: hypothetical protein A3G97_13240 [Candidatus Rokubacteria bacterium RIFCSPLOWO2_12_FULL_69_21]|nr:MAG: hypothetical protein A3G97_13240 [Candidatus Rokubacteria bacterium RIFCSPLOWO2_12_FULL_69_21]
MSRLLAARMCRPRAVRIFRLLALVRLRMSRLLAARMCRPRAVRIFRLLALEPRAARWSRPLALTRLGSS